jgi:hypothetical protein
MAGFRKDRKMKKKQIDLIKQAIARGYCSPENSGKTVDPVLIEAIAVEVMVEIEPILEKAWKYDELCD